MSSQRSLSCLQPNNFLCGSVFVHQRIFCLVVCTAIIRGNLIQPPAQIFKMSSRRNAPVPLQLGARTGSSIFPPNCFCKRRRFVFSSPRQLLSPGTVVRPVYMEESAKGVGGGGSMAALLETGKQMFPRQPRGVTSAHRLRPRCLHDMGARSADCGPKKTKWRHYSPPPLPENH